MLWISLYIMLAFAEESPAVSENVIWSNEQIVQQTLPELEGTNAALESQIRAKTQFFSGTGDVSSVFWQWKSENLLNITVLEMLKAEILEANKERLQERYPTFPFENPNGSEAKAYLTAYEQKWRYQNELDALDLKLIDALIHSVYLYPSIDNELMTLETAWLNKSELFIKDPTQQHIVAKIVAERRKVLDLRANIVTAFSNPNGNQDDLIIQVLSENPTGEIEIEGRFKRLSILEPLVTESSLTIQVQSELQKFVTLRAEQSRVELLQELSDTKQNWETFIFGWDLETTETKIQELSQQRKTVSKVNTDLQIEIIDYKLDLLQRHQSSLNGIQVEMDLKRAQEELDAARQKELEESEDERDAKIQSEIVRLKEIETKLLTNESERHRSIQDRMGDLKLKISDWDERYDSWVRLPPLDSSRKSIQLELQQMIHQLQWDLQALVSEVDTSREPKVITPLVEADAVHDVLESIKQAEDSTRKHIETEVDSMLLLWIEVHKKQDLLGYFEEEDNQFWSDVTFEWKYLSSTLQLNIDSIKKLFGDVNQVFGLFGLLFRWFLFGLVWLWMGRRMDAWWLTFQEWLEDQDRPEMFGDFNFQMWDVSGGDETSKRSVLIVRPLFFAVSSLLLVQYIEGDIPNILGSILLLFVFTNLCAPMTRFVTDDQSIRPPLKKGLVAFVWIVFGLNLLKTIFFGAFYVFQSVQLVNTIQQFLLFLWVIVQLGVWYELLHKQTEQVIGLERLKTLMLRFSDGFFGKRMRSVFATCIVLVDLSSKLIFWLVEHSSLFGSTLARNTIDNRTVGDGDSFDGHAWQLNWDALLQPEVDKIHSAIKAMSNEQGKPCGAMSLIADEGMGKSAILRRVLTTAQHPNHLLKVEDIIRDGQWTTTTLFKWLCDGLDIESQDNLEDICAAINSLPNSLLGIDDIQRVFLRDVQGFEVINCLFSIVQATSISHCWIVTCHQPTWTFWDSPSTPIRTDFFRHRYTLSPWSVVQIKAAFSAMMQRQGLSMDFSGLTTIANPQGVHRAEMAFWRLLTDSTKGNPATSLYLFKQCAMKTEDPKVVGIGMFSMTQTETLNQLDDGAGFVLACVLMHNRCTLDELCNSLQMPQSLIVSICRDLVSLSLLFREGVHYHIHPMWFPWVEANLAQKRFIGQRV